MSIFSDVDLFRLLLYLKEILNFVTHQSIKLLISYSWIQYLSNICFVYSFFHLKLIAFGEINIIQTIPIIVIFNTVLSRIALLPSPRIHSLPQPRQPKLLQMTPVPSTIFKRIIKNRFPSQVLKIPSNISRISLQAPQPDLP